MLTELIKKLKYKFKYDLFFSIVVFYFLIMSLINVYLYYYFETHLKYGVEKEAVILSLNYHPRGFPIYTAKVKENNNKVKFYAPFGLELGKQVNLLIKSDKPTNGVLGLKTNNLLELFTNTYSTFGTLFLTFSTISAILLMFIVCIF